MVNAGQPDADELVGRVLDALETDNLPVELAAVRSRHAPKDHHERLAAAVRLRLALLEAGDPPVPVRTGIAPFELGQQRRLGCGDGPESQNGDDPALHEYLSFKLRVETRFLQETGFLAPADRIHIRGLRDRDTTATETDPPPGSVGWENRADPGSPPC